MKIIYLILLLMSAGGVHAHVPELSSCMMYEQNGKTILLIRTSVTAFEGEIGYRYSKDAYKTPQAFKQLVIKDFEKNCFVVINNDTVQLINPYINLGHETTLFAELMDMPPTINTLQVKNTLFKDFNNNKCELILMLKNYPPFQYILNKDNQLEVNLKLENGKWVVDEVATHFYKTSIFIFWGLFLSLAVMIGAVVVVLKKKMSSNP
ncbi:hypothetical protein [Parasediminibacterium sp. JCM 36343]|uniref:hypothetical protein n=1 Tax=Parasediminibacterium sp. JCM 36343 TaxID=3374279 RepID=UPI003979D30E